MKSFEIRNFKGLESLLISDLPLSSGNQTFNVLLYGENGVGKTSFTEAIRLAKFYTQLESQNIPANVMEPERSFIRESWMVRYMKDRTQPDFTIKVDDSVFNSTSSTAPAITEGVYIVDRIFLQTTPQINLNELITETSFTFNTSKTDLLSNEIIDMVINEVNYKLKNDFKEEIQLKRSQDNPKIIAIHDLLANEDHELNIHNRFNEAKQNLIKILLILTYVKLDKNDNDLIILDDIVISLDVTNRIILIDYILKELTKCQIIILTHSFGLFNLISHHLAATNKHTQWKSCSLYNINGKHGITTYPIIKEKKLSDKFKQELADTPDIHSSDLENQVRQHLEFLLHELAKIMTIGSHEETKNIIAKIESQPQNLYFCIRDSQIKTIYDLVTYIKSIVSLGNPHKTLVLLKRAFNQYDSSNEITNISDIIKQVDSYQKVVLHTGSHYQSGTLKPITRKELTIAIDLIDRLEKIVFQSNTKYPNGF